MNPPTSSFVILLMISCAGFSLPVLGFTSSSKPAFSVSKQRISPLPAVEILSTFESSDISNFSAQVGGLTAFSSAVNSFFQPDKYFGSFLTCSFKASAADIIAQKQEESTEEQLTSSDVSKTIVSDVDLSRNLGFLLFGGLYTGTVQNFLYSVLFPAWFGTEETWSVITEQVLADNLIFGPLVCLPVGYTFKTAFTSEHGLTLTTLRQGMAAYKNDIMERGILTKDWFIWIPVQLLTFSVIPHHFRIAFVVAVSSFWLLLSTVSAVDGATTARRK